MVNDAGVGIFRCGVGCAAGHDNRAIVLRRIAHSLVDAPLLDLVGGKQRLRKISGTGTLELHPLRQPNRPAPGLDSRHRQLQKLAEIILELEIAPAQEADLIQNLLAVGMRPEISVLRHKP